MATATNYLVNRNQPDLNAINQLNPDEISHIQEYLEQIKMEKINKLKSQNNNNFSSQRDVNRSWSPDSVHSYSAIRNPVQHGPHINNSLQENILNNGNNYASREYVDRSWASQENHNDRNGPFTRIGKKSDDYHNPYEYGSRQNMLPSAQQTAYTGPYSNDNNTDQFPGHIRNVNAESTLMQQETTHLPGQRRIMETERNRFELLPFDPQDTKHIVWKDNMPRGGYSSRNERLETY